jgi:predicted HTH domain antitoxin
MDTFTVRDLRERTGTLIKDATEGKLALVTRHGHPVFLAVPFDERLLELGLHLTIAIDLYKEGVLTLAKAAKLSDQSLEGFIEKLGTAGIPVVDYPPEDLDEEVASFG